MRALVLLLLFVVACDETAGGVRHDYVTRHRDAFVFEMPRADVVDALRGLLAEQGYELIENRGDSMRTKIRTDGQGRTQEYVVHFLDLKKKHGFMVQLVHVTKETDGMVASSYRDEDREWELIQRADPDAAYEIMSKANARADRVAPRAKQP